MYILKNGSPNGRLLGTLLDPFGVHFGVLLGSILESILVPFRDPLDTVKVPQALPIKAFLSKAYQVHRVVYDKKGSILGSQIWG